MPQSTIILESNKDASLLGLVKKRFKSKGFYMDEQGAEDMQEMLRRAISTSAVKPKRGTQGKGNSVPAKASKFSKNRFIIISRKDSVRYYKADSSQRESRKTKPYRIISRPQNSLENSVVILTRNIMLNQNTSVITSRDIQAALSRLCPLWPFC